jgi:hypothetical protein
MKVMRLEYAFEAFLDPLRLRKVLAFWAMPVAAGVVGSSLEATLKADVEMSAEGICSALLNGAHDFELVSGQSMALSICLPMRAEDIGDLDRYTPRPLAGDRGILMA